MWIRYPLKSSSHILEMVEIRQQNKIPQNKQRKRWSKVWEDFTKSTDGSGKAVCNHCKKAFDGSSKKGTTHLKNHSERCRRKRNNGSGDAPINVIDLIQRSFSFLDEEGNITKDWDSSVLKSRKVDVLQVYKEEKENLRRFLNNLSCRFSLKIVRFFGWCVLMVHYIDDSWELKRKFISCLKDTGDYKILIHNLKDVLSEWKINRNACSIVTVGFTEGLGELISSWVDNQVSLPFVELLFDNSWLVRILDCFIFNIIRTFDPTKGINQCLGYVYKSPSNRDMFKIAVDKAKSMGKNVNSEHVPSRFYFFKDFEIAVGSKEAFRELEQMDPHFKSINLTKEQWDEATVICEHLKPLNDSARSLSSGKCTTLNVYFPMVCDIYTKLLHWKRSEHFRFRERATHVLKEFVDTYWSKCNLILAIAVVLDPRFKMNIVEKWYKEIYGSEADGQLEKIRGYLTFVLNEYAKSSETGDATSLTSYKMLDVMGRPCTSSREVVDDDDILLTNSELDRYLSEPTLPRVEQFNILTWWRAYIPIFPILARMAHDFLPIPIHSLTTSEDNFIKRKFMYIFVDKEFDDDTKEAMVCLTQWM